MTDDQVGPPSWWAWGNETVSFRWWWWGGMVHWICDSVLAQQWLLEVQLLTSLEEVGQARLSHPGEARPG